MIRYLKPLGLVLAILATSASVASAQQGELTADGPVTLRGTESGANSLTVPDFKPAKVECPGSIHTAHKYDVTPHTLIPSGATTITLTPHYWQEKCVGHDFPLKSTTPMTIDMNGCDYVLHINETTPVGNSKGTYGVTTDIVCPEGKSIDLTLFETDTAENPWCILHIKPQTSLQGAHATLTLGYSVSVQGTLEGIHAERTKSATTPLLCQASTLSTVKFHLALSFEGLNEGGAPTLIAFSEQG